MTVQSNSKTLSKTKVKTADLKSSDEIKKSRNSLKGIFYRYMYLYIFPIWTFFMKFIILQVLHKKYHFEKGFFSQPSIVDKIFTQKSLTCWALLLTAGFLSTEISSSSIVLGASF